MPVIIVEGVVATGKSTLVQAITESPKWSSMPTRLVISEHYTERVLELTQPKVSDRVGLLNSHMSSIKHMDELWRQYRFCDDVALSPAVLLERFHFTHAAQVGDFAPFETIDRELSELGAVVVFMYHPRELLLRHIMATEHERNPMWQRWLRSLGTEQEIKQYFWRLQENAMSLVKQSRLKVITVEAYSKTAAELADEVLGFSVNF